MFKILKSFALDVFLSSLALLLTFFLMKKHDDNKKQAVCVEFLNQFKANFPVTEKFKKVSSSSSNWPMGVANPAYGKWSAYYQEIDGLGDDVSCGSRSDDDMSTYFLRYYIRKNVNENAIINLGDNSYEKKYVISNYTLLNLVYSKRPNTFDGDHSSTKFVILHDIKSEQ